MEADVQFYREKALDITHRLALVGDQYSTAKSTTTN